jgi:hypothetical protein
VPDGAQGMHQSKQGAHHHYENRSRSQ